MKAAPAPARPGEDGTSTGLWLRQIGAIVWKDLLLELRTVLGGGGGAQERGGQETAEPRMGDSHGTSFGDVGGGRGAPA